jgi:hypothetical protein
MAGRLQHGTIHYTAAEIAAMAGGGPGGGGVPIGAILMWSGTLANIPDGYHLCDGTTGTPDLRSKFVKGAAAGQNPGGTGGSTTYSHAGGAVQNAVTGITINNESTHTHGAGTLALNNHAASTTGYALAAITLNSHTTTSKSTSGSGTTLLTGPTSHTITEPNGGNGHYHSTPAYAHSWSGGATGAGSSHSHGVTEPNAGAGHDHSFTQPNDHTGVEPPYYAVAFIMRLS